MVCVWICSRRVWTSISIHIRPHRMFVHAKINSRCARYFLTNNMFIWLVPTSLGALWPRLKPTHLSTLWAWLTTCRVWWQRELLQRRSEPPFPPPPPPPAKYRGRPPPGAPPAGGGGGGVCGCPRMFIHSWITCAVVLPEFHFFVFQTLCGHVEVSVAPCARTSCHVYCCSWSRILECSVRFSRCCFVWPSSFPCQTSFRSFQLA